MNPLSHIVEPVSLLLTWQSLNEQAATRTWRAVGEVFNLEDGTAAFRYLAGTPDYLAAAAAGFKGFPAFLSTEAIFQKGVIESFLRRLPPRGREDFAEYLAQHRLPSPFAYSDFALLDYTGARLPSDGFALVPVFPNGVVPCDYLMEGRSQVCVMCMGPTFRRSMKATPSALKSMRKTRLTAMLLQSCTTAAQLAT